MKNRHLKSLHSDYSDTTDTNYSETPDPLGTACWMTDTKSICHDYMCIVDYVRIWKKLSNVRKAEWRCFFYCQNTRSATFAFLCISWNMLNDVTIIPYKTQPETLRKHIAVTSRLCCAFTHCPRQPAPQPSYPRTVNERCVITWRELRGSELLTAQVYLDNSATIDFVYVSRRCLKKIWKSKRCTYRIFVTRSVHTIQVLRIIIL